MSHGSRRHFRLVLIKPSIFDRRIQLRERERISIKLTIQVDTLCHRIPRFIENAARACVVRVFGFGLEWINPDSLLAAKKTQNRTADSLRFWPAFAVDFVAKHAQIAVMTTPAIRPPTFQTRPPSARLSRHGVDADWK